MTIKLYCFGESGNAYKAALALELSGLDWEPVYVDFFGGETRTPEYRRDINEMGEVPVLVDGDFRTTQSGADPGLCHREIRQIRRRGPRRERRGVLRWVLWDNHKLSSSGRHDPLSDELPARGQAPGRGDRLHAGPPQGRL